jgi:hypothetical protein
MENKTQFLGQHLNKIGEKFMVSFSAVENCEKSRMLTDILLFCTIAYCLTPGVENNCEAPQ